MNHIVVSWVTQHVICDYFSNSFNFLLQLLNSVLVGVVYMIFEVDLKEVIAGTYVQKCVARTCHTRSTLEICQFDRTQLPNTSHKMSKMVFGMWLCTILLDKCSAHMPSSLNDQNDLILQLLQVLLVCYGALHRDWSSKPMLANCIPHGAFSEWSDISTIVWIFRGSEPDVLLVHECIEVEIGYLTNQQAVQGGAVYLSANFWHSCIQWYQLNSSH